jgi:hypothetical protein
MQTKLLFFYLTKLYFTKYEHYGSIKKINLYQIFIKNNSYVD